MMEVGFVKETEVIMNLKVNLPRYKQIVDGSKFLDSFHSRLIS